METSQRRQSYVPATGVEIIFEGPKTYWKTRTNLDLIFAMHLKLLCIEICAFDAEKGKEAPRIYVSSILLSQKVDQADLQRKLSEKKEILIKQKKSVNVPQLTKDLFNCAITQYILARLQIGVQEEPESPFTVFLQPLMGDTTNGDVLDIVCTMPTGLEPLQVNFQKKITASDISNALNSFQASAEELRRATKLAELATSSVDGFKLMLAEKMRLEAEMKKKFSPARLRWIRAINRVLIQNYVEAVKVRLERSEREKEEALRQAALQEALAAASLPKEKGAKPKILRKSIDNSMLTSDSLPALNVNVSAKASSKPSLASNSQDNHDTSLPSLTPSSRRQRASTDGTGEKLTRRTLQNDTLSKYLPGADRDKERDKEDSKRIRKSQSLDNNDHPPTLAQSYSSKSQKVLQPLPATALTELREVSVKSMRAK